MRVVISGFIGGRGETAGEDLQETTAGEDFLLASDAAELLLLELDELLEEARLLSDGDLLLEDREEALLDGEEYLLLPELELEEELELLLRLEWLSLEDALLGLDAADSLELCLEDF